MKANLKGRGGIKGLFLRHGEKVAIVLVGLAALWLVYSSLKLPKLGDQRQAAKLQEEIRLTRSAVDESKWPEPGSETFTEVREAVAIEKRDDLTVKPEAYGISPDGWNRIVVAPTVRRTDPELRNVVDVRATGGSGLFAFIDEEVRRERARAALEKEQQKAKEAEKKLEREQQQQDQLGRGGYGEGGRGRVAGPGAEYGFAEVDPEHPKRRPVEGMTRPAGVPTMGDERIERVYWATVVAKVPIREQLKLFQDAFEKARGGYIPERDFPRYVGYLVERTEVAPGQQPQRVPLQNGQNPSVPLPKGLKPLPAAVTRDGVAELYKHITQLWAGQSPDVVDERYIDYVLTLPLPPLTGRDWGAEATHPDIPLLANTPPLEEEVMPPVEQQPAEKPAETDERAIFSSNDPNQALGPQAGYGPTASRGGGYGRGMYSEMGRGGGYGYGMDGEMGRGGGYGGGGYGYGEGVGRRMGYGEEEGGRGGYGGEMSRGGYSGGYGRAAGTRTTLPRGVDFWLLRFFDFTVEPGKKYRYRVKLVLTDPNQSVLEDTLDSTVISRLQAAKAKGGKQYPIRYTDDWSEPSPVVGIPLSGSVRLAETKLPAADKFNDEPSVKLLVESFDLDEKGNAIHAGMEKDFRRGAVANMLAETEYLDGGGRWIDTHESFKFFTGITLLDVEGGDKLAKDTLAPSRVLLMDSAGELYIHNELDDATAVQYHRILFEKPDKRRGGRGEEGEMPYGPGGYGRGEGGYGRGEGGYGRGEGGYGRGGEGGRGR